MYSPRFLLSSSHASLFTLCSIWLLLFVGRSSAQAANETTTDPTEVAALNAIFDVWRISSVNSSTTAAWNTSGDPCSGTAIDSTTLDDNDFIPAIKCNCNTTTCHITVLKVRGIGLSAIIPRQLGSLQELITLDIGMNSFSGSVPEELGNLTNLQKLRLDSLGLGVSGEIPPSFANLKKLQILWAFDNNFTGRIPDFIGSLTELTDLRLHGNSLQGPIPPNLINLSKLSYLHIGELLNSSLNLELIANMSSLKFLILRNNQISSIIPSNTSLTNLKLLDLSFNNLTGPIPQSLFNLPSLNHLFLGNNSLSGTLPIEKSSKLENIDLSYNELSGSFPSWVGESELNVNLVGNNYIINSNTSIVPPRLRCVQKSMPCNHNVSTLVSSFAINCGSSKSVSVLNDPLYEVDEDRLGAASYNVSNEHWAVSNVGWFADVSIPNYIQSIGSRFPNTQNSELFQATRLSPSSLRYYGIGLEDGNYNVKLQFADTDNWEKTGRRFFDIYVQGIRKEKDFNIFKEASNTTLAAVERNYTATVANNFLEIHFFWTGKGTCCIPVNGTYGPSVSAITVTNSESKQAGQTGTQKKANKALTAGIAVLVVVLFAMLILGIFIWRRKRKQFTLSDDEELFGLSTRPNSFSYSELKTATKDFDETNKVGEGGFGPVYKGTLSDGREIAAKRLLVASVQGKRQFITEIATISAVQHRNLVKLYGCCYEGDRRLLVYEYLANRSLDKVLFDSRNSNLHLDWPARFRICLGTARGLAYLHEESSVPIVHRDVKASNILLDSDLNPKVSDFGLAKLRDDTKSHITTGVAGTIGYLAPEYAMRGQLTEKADVFGFGVVALEILCGRKNTDPSLGAEKTYLLEWAWHLHEEKRDLEMIDPAMSSYDREEAIRVVGVAFLCTQASPARRPLMSRAVAMLLGDMDVPEVLNRPSYLMDWRNAEVNSSLATGSSSAATTSTKDDLNVGTWMGFPSLSSAHTRTGIGEGR